MYMNTQMYTKMSDLDPMLAAIKAIGNPRAKMVCLRNNINRLLAEIDSHITLQATYTPVTKASEDAVPNKTLSLFFSLGRLPHHTATPTSHSHIALRAHDTSASNDTVPKNVFFSLFLS